MSRKRSQIPWEDAKKDALNQFGRTGGEMRNNLARLLHFMSGNEDNSELRKLIDTVKMDREKVFAAVQLSNGDAGTALTEMWKPFRGGINFMNFVKLVHDKLMQQDEYKRYIRRDLLRLIDNGLREEIGEQLKQGTIDKFNEEAEQEGTLASKLKKMWNFIFEHIDDPDVTEVKLLMERVGLYPFVITNRRKSVAEFLFTLFSANRGRVLHEFLNSLYIDLKRDVDKIMQMYGEGGLEDGSGPMEAPVGAPMGVEEEPEEEKSFVIPKELLDQEGYNIAMRDECVHAGDKIHFNVVVAETQLTIESGATVLAHFVGEGTQINLEEGASIIILKAADECEDSPIIINGEALDTANLPIVIEGYTENGEAEEPVRDSGSEDDEDDDLNGFLEEDAPIVIEKDGETIINRLSAGEVVDIKSPRAIVRINSVAEDCKDNPAIINTPNSNVRVLLGKENGKRQIPHTHVLIGHNVDWGSEEMRITRSKLGCAMRELYRLNEVNEKRDKLDWYKEQLRKAEEKLLSKNSTVAEIGNADKAYYQKLIYEIENIDTLMKQAVRQVNVLEQLFEEAEIRQARERLYEAVGSARLRNDLEGAMAQEAVRQLKQIDQDQNRGFSIVSVVDRSRIEICSNVVDMLEDPEDAYAIRKARERVEVLELAYFEKY